MPVSAEESSHCALTILILSVEKLIEFVVDFNILFVGSFETGIIGSDELAERLTAFDLFFSQPQPIVRIDFLSFYLSLNCLDIGKEKIKE